MRISQLRNYPSAQLSAQAVRPVPSGSSSLAVSGTPNT